MKRAVVLVLLLVVGGAVALVAWVTTRGFSARDEPSALEAFVARKLRSLATPAGVNALRTTASCSTSSGTASASRACRDGAARTKALQLMKELNRLDADGRHGGSPHGH